MKTIKFPLNAGMTGPDVADLHAVLQLLLSRALIAPDDPQARQGLARLVAREAAAQNYGSGTAKTVSIYQQQERLQETGDVDANTARALNTFIASEGGGEVAAQQFIVSGRITRDDALPFPNAAVRAFHEMREGGVRLGEDTTDGEGRYTIRYVPLPGTKAADLRVTVSDARGDTVQRSDILTAAPPIVVVNLTIPVTEESGTARRVEGRLLLDYGEAGENVQLRLYRRTFGGGATLLGEGTTRAHGVFTLPYSSNGRESLEVRALDATGAEIPISDLVDDEGVEERTVVNLVAPAKLRPLTAEFDRLATALTPHVGDVKELGKAQESADRQDLTLLNRATGWDARLIALAANAATLSAATNVGLAQDELYGLFRAGLPTDPLQLAGVGADMASKALERVAGAGIVAIDAQRLGTVKERFEQFATAARLAIPAPGARSTYGQLLQAAPVSDAARQQFAPVFLNHTGTGAELWEKAKAAGVSDDDVASLQRQGKLAFLTANSQPMTQRLQQQLQVQDPSELVDRDFDRAATWKVEVTTAANNDPQQLAAIVPTAYQGATVDERLDAYAEDMARKVRVSYPTQVAARILERDTDDALRLGPSRAPAAALMRRAATVGFRLGQTPVETFIRDHPAVLDAVAPNERKEATQTLKMMQRVYQVTPSDDAMQVLLQAGISSAYDITALSRVEFLDRFGDRFPTREQAELVYRKAQQVSSVTMNLYGMMREMDGAPEMKATSGLPAEKQLARLELQKHFPTMENLFGSMDFCECEHCRSVLSPAAYLVDILQFVDPEAPKWDSFLARWKRDHAGAEYTASYKKPFDELVERRPDIPHIPLTCENTQVAMPYIDIVNEVLEYYVANNALAADAARDTGDATTPDLLAEPQYQIPQAYDVLLGARYPLHLPFDLWLESVRRFCEHFEMPFHAVLEAMRRGDDLVGPALPYDRTAIFAESLGLSPAEWAILTDPDPLDDWFTLYGYANAPEAMTPDIDPETKQRIDLNSAKALARRLGVTYKELTDIVRTGFVNPKLETLVVLYKMRIGVQEALFYERHKPLLAGDPTVMDTDDLKLLSELETIVARLDATTKEYAASGFDARAWLDQALADGTFKDILVLADPNQGCNFDETTLRYADSRPCDPIAFLRINLFTRIWRKLGWSMAETDRALQAFIPRSTPYDVATLADRPLASALIQVAHLAALEKELKVGKRTREKLLALWTPIAATGERPLYAELFLGRSVLRNDPVFDDALGRYLQAPGILIKDHLLALQGALGLTAADIPRILSAAGLAVDTAPLTLANVSLLYRHALLAKALKLGIPELIALRELSGLDPFKPVSSTPLATLDDDAPYTQTMRFVSLARLVKSTGFKLDELDWLLRHRFDPTGPRAPDATAMLARTKALADGIRAIRNQHAVPADTGAMDDDALRQVLSLVLPADVVATVAAMMAGTVEFTVAVPNVPPAAALDPASFASVTAIRAMKYDATRQEQSITWRGVLFDAEKGTLKTQFPSPTFGSLLDAVQGASRGIFDRWLLKQPPGTIPDSGFLQASDYDRLFTPIPEGITPDQQQARLRDRRGALARSFLPHLQQRLVRDLVARAMAAETGGEPELVRTLVTDASLLGDPGTLLDAFAGVAVRGVDATFFAAPDLSDPPLATITLPDADLSARDEAGNALMPVGAGSARLRGYLEVATPGAYRFHVALDKKSATATLRFDHLATPLIDGVAAADGSELSEFTTLQAGVPYPFTLELTKLDGGAARVLAQGETLPKDRLSRLALYPHGAVDRADRAFTLLTKSLRIVDRLQLTERELRYILAHSADFGGIALSLLPTGTGQDGAVESTARFDHLMRLAEYARLREEMAGGSDELIAAFAAPTVDGAYDVIARLTRRERADVMAAAEAIFAAPAIRNELALRRLWDVLQLVERFGIPVATLRQATKVVDKALAQNDRRLVAKALKDAVRARFDEEAWRNVAQPIFDVLRRRQRDALTAHVMHTRRFGTIEELYEHFLIDPGMEPVVQTSRIRLAIASVQLFIHRTLLSLEKKVHPTALNGAQWEWMKRYRVWEANRKIFLFPENWLEPEFRDDKSHLYQELESQLLQGDISNDAAEDAFLQYLQKLEAMARLEIVGMHCQDDADATLNTLHVIGRTYSQPYQYFYRKLSNRMWTPWEPVSAEPEGNHLLPVWWRDRLYLFWVTFHEQAAQAEFGAGSSNHQLTAIAKVSGTASNGLQVYDTINGSSGTSTKKLTDVSLGDIANTIGGAPMRKNVEARLHWSEYLQGEWSPRKTGSPDAVLTANVPSSFNADSVFVHVSVGRDADGEEAGVFVHLGGSFNRAFHLAGRNSIPEPALRFAPPTTPYTTSGVVANRYRGSGALQVTFTSRIVTEDRKAPVSTTTTSSILAQGGVYTILPADNSVTLVNEEVARMVTPFFYQDNTEQTFFVEPQFTERTIEQWEEWVTRTPVPDYGWTLDDDFWKEHVVPAIPRPKLTIPIDPRDPLWTPQVGVESKFKERLASDWLLNDRTALSYGDEIIGPGGRAKVAVLASGALSRNGGLVADGRNGGALSGALGDVRGRLGADIAVDLEPSGGGRLADRGVVIAAAAEELEHAGLAVERGGRLRVVGREGLNSTLRRDFGAAGRFGGN